MKAPSYRIAAILLATCPMTKPAFARDPETDALRAEIEALKASVTRLEARLRDVESHPYSDAQPPAARAPNSDAGAVDLDDLPRNGVVGPSEAASPISWELAPPGPIDMPLRPMRDGNAAAFELLAGSGGGRASFSLSRSKDSGGEPGPETTAVGNDTFALTLSAPLAKDGDTTFATLDGLASGTKLEIGYTRFTGRVVTQAADSRDPALVAARQRCRDAKPAYEPGCTRLDDAFMDRFFTPAERDAYERDYARKTLQQSFAWSLNAAVGYDQFDYYPLSTLAKAIARKVSWNLGAALVAFPFDRTSTSIGVDYQHAYKARKAQTVCPVAAPGAVSVTCVPGPLLGPQRDESLILSTELRHLLPLSNTGLIRSLGFAPRIEIGALDGEVSLDLPVYFAVDEKDGLIGGIRFGYATDGDDVLFGVFLGKSFSVFP